MSARETHAVQYATVGMPLSSLEGFAAFIDAVRADAAAVAESTEAHEEPEEEAAHG